MSLTALQIQRYKSAGYRFFVSFEVSLPIAGLWTSTGYPVIGDTLLTDMEACKRREAAREIRNWRITSL
jgi:hypothetical protein